ncbi:hypothetical protein IAG44_20640 [Streptomyces roseirectus]|uniref:Uncharacterized protein n=1 Tax=Streptomyces roseirectus TaxID=2768066 RepID=A0A7H0IFN3_9ACTN|nr:hypothetical protein [Streptomyces roseirectus]QNP71599.1 hypothetical protein IAG44_20640 [Streptomyces roseirectus]
MTTDHPTPAAFDPTPAAAQAALTGAHAARAAARTARARRIPAWHPPVAGLLFAAGFTGLALYTDSRHVVTLAASLVCLLAFLALFGVHARAGGVVLRPTGTPRERWLRQSPALISTALAVATAFLITPSAALAVFGVAQGALTWLQLHRERTRPTA